MTYHLKDVSHGEVVNFAICATSQATTNCQNHPKLAGCFTTSCFLSIFIFFTCLQVKPIKRYLQITTSYLEVFLKKSAQLTTKRKAKPNLNFTFLMNGWTFNLYAAIQINFVKNGRYFRFYWDYKLVLHWKRGDVKFNSSILKTAFILPSLNVPINESIYL